jgi:hypothetical protein
LPIVTGSFPPHHKLKEWILSVPEQQIGMTKAAREALTAEHMNKLRALRDEVQK